MKLERNCPGCGGTIVYKIVGQKNEAERKKRLCVPCRKERNWGRKHTEEHKKRMSVMYTGAGNPQYGKKASDETRKKLSASRTGSLHYLYGKHLSQETRAKISATCKGRVVSLQTREKMSKSLKGRVGPNKDRVFSEQWRKNIGKSHIGINKGAKSACYGKPLSDDHKLRIGKTLKGKYTGDKHPMFGKHHSTETKDQLSRSHKNRAAPHEIGWGYCGYYKGHHFRSTCELVYIMELEAQGLDWESAEKGDLQIMYTHPDGRTRSYHADFLVSGSLLVEIKPIYRQGDAAVVAKALAARAFCESRGMTYKMLEVTSMKHLDLYKLYLSGAVVMKDKWVKRLKAKLPKGWIHE